MQCIVHVPTYVMCVCFAGFFFLYVSLDIAYSLVGGDADSGP
jgi:hypothetical protein